MGPDPTAPLRVAMLAPPWIPVPAPAYGGIEEVVRLLCEGLVVRGHAVTLFAPPGSSSAAHVHPPLDAAHPQEIQSVRVETDHVARAFAAINAGDFDVVHDHTGYVALAMADRLGVPLVHTLHGPFDADACTFYAAHGRKAVLVALSAFQRDAAPAEAGVPEVVPNPLAVDEWPFAAEKEDFVLWIGRMSPDKGPQRAIDAARRAGVPIVLAGPVQPGQEEFFAAEVEPHIDGDAVRYAGEADSEAKRDLYRRARGLLMPIRWPEPFGLVMVEAMACGTPVVAFREGSVPEVVREGETGFVVDDEAAMAEAIGRLDQLDPARCREVTAERFGVDAVVERYEAVYRRAASGSAQLGLGVRDLATPQPGVGAAVDEVDH
jgi:glycosyltransferase involved in cell wall biosynthesis